jgi:hypothetical protein
MTQRQGSAFSGLGSAFKFTRKAGAGKPTLMKYIYENPQTEKCLQRWSQSKQLVGAAFFFWNSGTKLQMSKEGLLRSLLYQSLRRFWDLVPRVFPGLWEAYSLFNATIDPRWTLQGLFRAFQLLIEEGKQDKRFCFLIDGLDEFNGDLTDLVTFFQQINLSSPHVKLCVLSRPWIIFEDQFKDKPKLRLEDLTFSGIQQFVAAKLHESAGFKELDRQEPEYARNLVKEIVAKSSGVFLWVDLVVKSLLNGLTNQGKYERAEEMNRQALGLRETVLGKEHPDTLTSMNNLALVRSGQGKYKQAEEMNRQALGLSEMVLGKEHPFTLTSMNNLAFH